MKINEKDNFNSLYLLALMHKHYRFIIGALIVAFLVSIVFSSPLFITPKYKSTVILFPSSSNSISKALLTDQVDLKQDILQYGEDDQIDQMLQVLASNRIRDRIIQKYNLLEHYDLRKSTYKYTKLYNEYEKNIKFRRTEFMAVSISVLDTDPQLAADIANEIAALYDSTCVQMQKDRAMQAFKIVEGTYLGLVNEIKVMEDSLAILRQLGVNDYETQSEMINQQLAIQVANNNQQGVRELQKQIDILAKYGTPYVSIRDQLDYDKQQLSLIKVKYEEAKIDAEQELSQKFVISEAYKAERKSYPIR
jgi:capsular polysaccharide biosynthesis protein